MKLGTVTKLDKRNKTMSKKIEDDIMSENYDVILIFLIFGQFGAIRKLDSFALSKGTILTKNFLILCKKMHQQN